MVSLGQFMLTEVKWISPGTTKTLILLHQLCPNTWIPVSAVQLIIYHINRELQIPCRKRRRELAIRAVPSSVLQSLQLLDFAFKDMSKYTFVQHLNLFMAHKLHSLLPLSTSVIPEVLRELPLCLSGPQQVFKHPPGASWFIPIVSLFHSAYQPRVSGDVCQLVTSDN